MNNQENTGNTAITDDQKSVSTKQPDQNSESNEVNIQPSETDSGTEENAPGRTAGKAEGSREIVEEDLAEKEI